MLNNTPNNQAASVKVEHQDTRFLSEHNISSIMPEGMYIMLQNITFSLDVLSQATGAYLGPHWLVRVAPLPGATCVTYSLPTPPATLTTVTPLR